MLDSNPPLIDWKTRAIIPQLLPIHENDPFSHVSAVVGQALCVEEAGLDEEEGTEANFSKRRARFWDAFETGSSRGPWTLTETLIVDQSYRWTLFLGLRSYAARSPSAATLSKLEHDVPSDPEQTSE